MTSIRKRIIAGNWKMNCNREEAMSLAQGLVTSFKPSPMATMIVCVPSIHVADVAQILSGSEIQLGVQNAHWEASGAYTGEVSVNMLADYSVDYLLVGHSERREIFGETDEMVANKFGAALKLGITPILCIGETLEQREAGKTLEVLKAQCQAVIDKVGVEVFKSAVIAYEPIWAIGTGKTASPQQAHQVHSELRVWFARKDASIAQNLQILYGGSMNATNASDLLAQPDIDGGLIGGASLKVEDFLNIYSAAG
ncbi:triose-phosphate isomerase [Aliikangiella sp. IMCC44653]